MHDLWPLSPIELAGMSPHHPFARLCSWAEGTAYRQADTVVSMLPKVHDYMASRGLDLRRLRIVPNGVDLDEWARPPAPLDAAVRECLDQARRQGLAIVGYAGSMGLPNALDTLLNVAHALRDQDLAFVLVGDGHERARLQQRITAEGLHKVHLLPPIPKGQIPRFLQALDVAYIGWQRMPLYRFGIAPNKLMDYMMAGCPVLHAVDAGNDPVAEAGCGLTVPPDDEAAIARGLLTLLRTAEASAAAGDRWFFAAVGSFADETFTPEELTWITSARHRLADSVFLDMSRQRIPDGAIYNSLFSTFSVGWAAYEGFQGSSSMRKAIACIGLYHFFQPGNQSITKKWH